MGKNVDAIVWLVVLGTSIWVAVDASNLGVRRGATSGGFFDMGVAGWLLCCLLLWIVGFPAYLVMRRRYVEAHQLAISNQGHLSTASWQPEYGASVTAPTGSESRLLADLSRLAALRDSGGVSEDEFQTLKARLIQQSGR